MSTSQPLISQPDEPRAPKDRPKVLVGIVTRNRAAILPQAINSALAQDYPNARIVVLDDGSEDETPRLRFRFAGVHWLRSETSLGFMVGRNQLMHMPAQYFLSLDDDAWFIKGDEIGTAAKYLEENPHVAAVAFDILGPSRPQPRARTTPRPIHMFMGCGHVLRLSAARKAGLYHLSPEPYGAEERDLSIRLIDKQMEVHLLPGVHVWHERANVSRDLGVQHQMGVCNDLAFVIQRCPLILIPLVFPIKLINHLRFGLRQYVYFKPCLSGILLFWSHLPGIWKKREPVGSRTFIQFLQLSRSA